MSRAQLLATFCNDWKLFFCRRNRGRVAQVRLPLANLGPPSYGGYGFFFFTVVSCVAIETHWPFRFCQTSVQL